jgi:ADP-heptose:LPS heptosyltransferase
MRFLKAVPEKLKEIVKFSYVKITLCIDWIFISNDKKIKKDAVVIVRLDAIGDFFLWLQGAKELRNIYPKHHIVLVANNTWAEFARALPYWDEVWNLDQNKFIYNWIYRIKFIKKINRFGFSIAIQPTYSRVFESGDCIINASNACKKIGFNGDLCNTTKILHDIGNSYYTELITSFGDKMELERNLEFIQKIAPYQIKIQIQEIPRVLNLRDEILPSKKYYIIFPGASWDGKRWPEENFSEIIKKLEKLQKWQPILCGSYEEKELCDRIIKLSRTENCINYAGQTNLMELVELIRGAELLISNDTSAIHIAPLVNTKSVCIVGGGHFGRFLPYPDKLKAIKPLVSVIKLPCFQCNWKCTIKNELKYPVPCIAGVQVNQVLDNIKATFI